MVLAGMLVLLLTAQDGAQGAVATKVKPLGSPATWISDDDYPGGALRREEFGTVRFALGIDKTGKVSSCHVLATSGFVELDQTACAILLKRARFSAARDAADRPIDAVYSGSFSWLIPGGPVAERIAREPVPGLAMTLTLSKLPQGYARPALLRVHFTPEGKPDACKAEIGSGLPALDKIACEQAIAQATRPVETLKWNRKPDTTMVEVSFEAQ